jgi:hypothetical protein
MKNPNLVYQAKSFYNAYIALEQLKPDDKLLLLVPTLVNGAFSVELIIKAILVEQDIQYKNEHNLQILFEKLPLDIQNKIWKYLVEKSPKYSNKTKRENELLLISDAFVQWRYCYEGKLVPAFDACFLSAFANATIRVMFELGYNAFWAESEIPPYSEEYDDIDMKFAHNRSECMKRNQEKILKKIGDK